MNAKKQEMVKVEYVVPAEMQESLTEKITEAVKNSYWGNVGRAVSEKVTEALNEDGFAERVAMAVTEKIKISEEEFVQATTEHVKESLMNVTKVLTGEVLRKVEEKIKSYGFIQIGR